MITFPDKKEGDKIYPDELNAIKLGINDQVARLNMVDGDAYTAFGSVANRIDALEKYVLLLTQHNKLLSTMLTSALPEHFRQTVSKKDYDAIVADRDAKVAEVEDLKDQYETASQTDKAQIQQMINEAITAAAQKEKEVETVVKEELVESPIELDSDDEGDYIKNQLYIKLNIVLTDDEEGKLYVSGLEDVDQALLDKYQLTKVVQETGDKGITGTGLYQCPKGTDAKDVLDAIAYETGLMANYNKSKAQQADPNNKSVINAISVNRNTAKNTAQQAHSFVINEIFIRFRDGVDNATKDSILSGLKLDLKHEFKLTKANLYTIRDGDTPGIPWMYADRLAEHIEQANWEHVKYASLNNIMSIPTPVVSSAPSVSVPLGPLAPILLS